MSERPLFRLRDIERAFKAARSAGEKGALTVEIVDKDGNRVIITSREGEPVRGASEWRKRIEALS